MSLSLEQLKQHLKLAQFSISGQADDFCNFYDSIDFNQVAFRYLIDDPDLVLNLSRFAHLMVNDDLVDITDLHQVYLNYEKYGSHKNGIMFGSIFASVGRKNDLQFDAKYDSIKDDVFDCRNDDLDFKFIKSDPQTDIKSIKNDPQTDIKFIKSDPQIDIKSIKNDPQIDIKSIKSDTQTDIKSIKNDSAVDLRQNTDITALVLNLSKQYSTTKNSSPLFAFLKDRWNRRPGG